MLKMLQAHGLDAGPTQRPLLAGAAAGFLAAIPAVSIPALFGTLDALGGAARGIPYVVAPLTYCGALALGGLLYGALFQRAANDSRGGWLFGMAFGFVLWMVGPIPLLQWLPERPLLVGHPALGLLLSQLVWGLVLGLAFPAVHRELHRGLDSSDQSPTSQGRTIGPEAATLTWSLRQRSEAQAPP